MTTEWDAYIKASKWGEDNCIQDAFENCPFASVGGLDARQGKLRAPKYVAPHLAASYLAGYVRMAEQMYGKDWQIIKFSWQPALVIKDEQSTEEDSSK